MAIIPHLKEESLGLLLIKKIWKIAQLIGFLNIFLRSAGVLKHTIVFELPSCDFPERGVVGVLYGNNYSAIDKETNISRALSWPGLVCAITFPYEEIIPRDGSYR